MKISTGVENTLKIVDELFTAGMNRVVHQHFSVAHDGDRRTVTQALDVRNLFIPPAVFPRNPDPARNGDGI